MNKLKEHLHFLQDFLKYLRDFSIVVAGIAVTLSVDNYISLRAEKKEMMLYLNTIKLELEENLNIILLYDALIDQEIGYAGYLLSLPKDSLDADSIQRYAGIYHNITYPPFKSGAYEMFKSSGTMRLVADKEMLQAIWTIYSSLESLTFFNDLYYKDKKEYLTRERLLEETAKPNTIPMYTFYTRNKGHLGLKSIAQELAQGITALSAKF